MKIKTTNIKFSIKVVFKKYNKFNKFNKNEKNEKN
jgi:hypothetical protein